MIKMNSKQLRKIKPENGEDKQIKRNPIYIVCDNVLDTYNIGSIFRLSDAIAAQKIYLCGDCDFPPSSRIHKAAVGTEEWIAWEKRDTAIEAVKELKERGVQIVCVEQSQKSISYDKFKPQFPIAIVIGHETNGISSEVLENSDLIVELPMFGVNKSLNVWGSAAIIAYKAIEALQD